MSTNFLLEVKDLHVHFGSSFVLQGVDLQLDHESMGMLGRNGMGKTTLCNAIMGLVPITKGEIYFNGQNITSLSSVQRARLGIGYVPQGRRIFKSLSVEEHLKIMVRKNSNWTIDRVYETFSRLKERRHNYGDQLSGGEQQMLAISRALMLDPKLLILDEPTEGLAPTIVADVIELIKELSSQGMGVLLVEQNIHAAIETAKNMSIMLNGVIAKKLSANELKDSPAIRKKFLGIEPGQQ